MVSDQRDEGDYRIVAGALGGEFDDGYIAAVVIERVRGSRSAPCEAYRNDALAGGYRWPSAQAAMCYAIGKGRELVTQLPHRLAC